MPDFAAAATGVAAGIAGTWLAMRRAPRADAPSGAHRTAAELQTDTSTQRLLRDLPFPAFMLDRTGRLTFLNGAAEQLFDVSAARAVGRALIEVVPSVDFERQVAEALRGVSSTRDVRVIDGDRERIFGITAQALEGGGAIAIAADRTQMVSMERVRRDFVSNVSHELRTPLSTIKLMVETVVAAGDDPEARALFLPRVVREVDRMVQLIEDLLELARSESGRMTLRRRTFDLADVGGAVVNTFAQRASGAGIALTLDAPEEARVDADRDRLLQVAMNLVDNALRHTPEGGAVTVEVAREPHAAVLRVRDTGAGIPYKDLPHIFERFYVVDRSRSRDHSGTGLGLSIARHLVEAHGGTISASSVLGRGSTFVCRFPLARVSPS
ncbi:MAG: sensor histidine kinase [Candidatus Velthaea sp.]